MLKVLRGVPRGTGPTIEGRQMGSTYLPGVDRQTLAELYDRHVHSAYGLAHQITGRADVAAAVTEEVFRDLARTTAPEAFERRLLSEVHRRSVAWMRQACNPAAHPELVPAPSAHPDVTTGDQAGLSALPDDERTAISNAYFFGRTYTEIAAGMQVGTGQVAELLRRGLERLAATQAMPADPMARRMPDVRAV